MRLGIEPAEELSEHGDETGLRIGCARGDAGQLERLAVRGAHLPRLVDDEDRLVLRDAVEIATGGVPLLLELRIVVAEADDPSVLLQRRWSATVPGRPRALERGDIADFAVRRREQIGAGGLKPG